MARPATSIACPVCGQPFNAILEQILDAQIDPTSKERLLSGRVNLITCPHCGYRGMVGTPLMYHDARKQLAVVYMPMELNIAQEQRERIIGDMTNALMRALPEDAPKGYLLRPKSALTLQGLIDQVLEADGITPEMLDRERQKIDLIKQLAEAEKEARDQLLADNADLLDIGLIELLTAAAQAATQAGDNRQSLRLLNIREHLLETTEAGQQIKAQQEALVEASQELQALGQDLTRKKFVDLLFNAAENPDKVDALGTLGRAILDYSTFQVITERINQTTDPEWRKLYENVRDRMLEINAAYEQQARALMERAASTLRMLIQAPDIPQAIQANLDRIDDMFLQVLQVNLDEARKAGRADITERLRLIRDEVLKLIQASQPPEVQFINDLLSVESETEAVDLLRSRQGDVSADLLEVMGELANQLRDGGNEPAAQRLELLQAKGRKLL